METLEKIPTDQGEKSDYDAASLCSRCGYCLQSCPTYVATGDESKSPRGRNQLVRQMLEGKLKDPAAAREALSTCLLCGACSSVCYAHIPTAEIVLEGRRKIAKAPPLLARVLTHLLLERPRLLAFLLHAAYALKRRGLSKPFRPLLGVIGLKGLAVADEHTNEAPKKFLSEILGSSKFRVPGSELKRNPKPGTRNPEPGTPSWLYFAPCGPNYLFPRVGLATWEVLESQKGPGAFMDNACCGLLSYNYASVEDAKALARKNIEKLERLDEQRGSSAAPVVLDCSSCAAFAKSYPKLLSGDAAWAGRAERFSARVKDAIEMIEFQVEKTDSAGPTRNSEPGTRNFLVTYHESCRARNGEGLFGAPGFVKTPCGEGFREIPEPDVCCGGAGAFAFAWPDLSDDVLKRKISSIASVQADVVVTSATSCLLQLERGLKKYFRNARVLHASEFAVQLIHGKKAGA